VGTGEGKEGRNAKRLHSAVNICESPLPLQEAPLIKCVGEGIAGK